MSTCLSPRLLLMAGYVAPTVDLKELLLLLNDRIPTPHRLAVLEQSSHILKEAVVLVPGGGGSSPGHGVGDHFRRRGRRRRRRRQRRLSCGLSRPSLTWLLVSEV